MKRKILQIILGVVASIMFIRFGVPAVMYGTTGPGPLGDRWLEVGQKTTLLLDSDLRFFGVLMLGIGVLYIWMIPQVEKHESLIRIMAGTIMCGGAARVVAFFSLGMPGIKGILATVLEFVLPIATVALHWMVTHETDEDAR